MIFEYLEIVNIGIIENIKLVINKPLIAFYGEIKQGKTTILNCIKWGAGMKFPDDILRHGTDKGHIYMKFNNSSLKREFYRTKDGTTKAKKIKAIINGEIADKPIEAIKKLLNPFLLDQDFFIKKTALERQRYFLELLDIDKTLYDKKVAQIDDKATNLRAEIKAYGDIDVTPVQPVNIDEIMKARGDMLEKHKKELERIRKKNEDVKHRTMVRGARFAEIEQNDREIAQLKKELERKEKEFSQRRTILTEWLEENPELEQEDEPDFPDTTEYDQRISEGYAQNAKHDQYIENMKRVKEREDKKTELSSLEKQKKTEESKLMEDLAKIASKSNIPGLTFDKDANAFYENTALDMLSNAQQMSLSSALSALYPDGFGIELIDRGESLGKSIYEFIDKAKEKKLTILSAIVGERPAEVPDEMGVFVVEGGSLR